jgi:hypothetical protein
MINKTSIVGYKKQPFLKKWWLLLVLIVTLVSCKKDEPAKPTLEEIYQSLPAHILQPACSKKLSFDQWKALVEASDTSKLHTANDIIPALTVIRDIYAANEDLRGTFPVIYLEISKEIVRYAYSEQCQFPELLQPMTLNFAEMLFYNHYNHLMNRKVEEHWVHYFNLGNHCDVNKLRVGLGGVSSHIVIDLARSVHQAKFNNQHFEEYMYLGEEMVKAVPRLLSSLDEFYGIKGEYFLSGFFFGDMLDPMMGYDGATTKLVFQTVRLESWASGRMLQGSKEYQQSLDMMFTSWRNKEKLLNALAEQGLMDK